MAEETELSPVTRKRGSTSEASDGESKPDMQVSSETGEMDPVVQLNDALVKLLNDSELQQVLQKRNRALTILQGKRQTGYSSGHEGKLQLLPGGKIRAGSHTDTGQWTDDTAPYSLQTPDEIEGVSAQLLDGDGRALLEEGKSPQRRVTYKEAEERILSGERDEYAQFVAKQGGKEGLDGRSLWVLDAKVKSEMKYENRFGRRLLADVLREEFDIKDGNMEGTLGEIDKRVAEYKTA
jgi:hypothetical protein